MSAQELITEHLDLWTGAITKKASSGRGRGSNGRTELTGIKKLRELILELAVKGRLVNQNPNEEPAHVLLARLRDERLELEKNKKINKRRKTNESTNVDELTALPNSWCWSQLGEVAFKLTDGSHNPPRDSGRGIPMLSSQNVNFGRIDFGCPSRYLTVEDFVKEDARTEARPGDVLLTIVASLGRAAVVPPEAPQFALQRSVAVIGTPIDSEFLAYQLIAPKCLHYYETHGKGTAQKGIYLGKLAVMPIAVPPLEEQHRIVQKVDELMALCDRLEQQTSDQLQAHETLVDTLLGTLTQSKNTTELADNWARLAAHFDTLFTTEQSIDKLKQTILQLAVMGQLVEQDAGDEHAAELLKRIQEKKDQLLQSSKQRKAKPLPSTSGSEAPFSLPSGWILSRLDDITDIQGGIAKGKKISGKKTRTLPYLRVANVQRASLNLSEIKEIEIADDEVERYLVQQRDLLITEGGDWDKVGRTAIWDGQIEPIAHQNHVFRARLILDEQNEQWLECYLNSQFARDYFASSSKQTTNLASINKTQLRSCIVPLPPLEEQARIVKKVDELMALCDQLKEHLNYASKTHCQLADAVVKKAIS